MQEGAEDDATTLSMEHTSYQNIDDMTPEKLRQRLPDAVYKISNEEANAPTTSSDTKFQMQTPEDIRTEEERIKLRNKVYSKTPEGVQIIDLDLYEEVYGPPAESKDVS